MTGSNSVSKLSYKAMREGTVLVWSHRQNVQQPQLPSNQDSPFGMVDGSRIRGTLPRRHPNASRRQLLRYFTVCNHRLQVDDAKESISFDEYYVMCRIFGVFTVRCTQCQRGIAIVSRPSVRPSVCLSVCPSVTMYLAHIGWISSKLITRIISLGSSLLCRAGASRAFPCNSTAFLFYNVKGGKGKKRKGDGKVYL